jgi:hypothetical protein
MTNDSDRFAQALALAVRDERERVLDAIERIGRRTRHGNRPHLSVCSCELAETLDALRKAGD